MSTRNLILAAVMGLVMTACSKKTSTPDETATPVGDPAPAAPARERPRLTGAECEAKSGVVVGDIGDGAVHRPDYKCADGQAPIAKVLLSLLDQLGWTIDSSTATRLYASLVFDTQNFRFIRASANSHTIAARMLPLVKDPERIHEYLLANLTPSMLGFMAQGLSRMRIQAEGRLAVVVLERDIFHRYGADPSDSGDVVDMALNVHSVKIAMLLREEAPGRWKVSLRSKKGFSVLEAAENVFGSGHRNAAGATVTWESLATKTNAASDPSASNLSVAIEARLKPLLLEEIRRNM